MRDFCTKDLALGSIFQKTNNAFYVKVLVHINFSSTYPTISFIPELPGGEWGEGCHVPSPISWSSVIKILKKHLQTSVVM
jgi:hypothetical protein